MAHVDESYANSIQLLESYTRVLVKEGINSDILQNTLLHFIRCRQKEKVAEQVYSEIVEQIESANDQDETEKMMEMYKNKFEDRVKDLDDPETSPEYLAFLSSIESEICDEGGEIETVSENLNTIDPISKRNIVDPVKNTRCGHSYEKSTILELIATRPNTRCPIVGCSAMTYIKESELVPDLQLKKHLDRLKSQPNL